MNIAIIIICSILGLATIGSLDYDKGDFQAVVYIITAVLLLVLIWTPSRLKKIGFFTILLISLWVNGTFRNKYVFRTPPESFDSMEKRYVNKQRILLNTFTKDALEADIMGVFQTDVIKDIKKLEIARMRLNNFKGKLLIYNTQIQAILDESIEKLSEKNEWKSMDSSELATCPPSLYRWQ